MHRHILLSFILLISIACSRSEVAIENEDMVQSIQSEDVANYSDFNEIEEQDDTAQMFLKDLREQGIDAEIIVNGDRNIASEDLNGAEYIEGQYIPGSEEAKSLKRLRDQGVSYYTVKENETLMLISYKLYGDYTRWIELAELNTNSSKDQIYAGTKIKYYKYGSGYKRNTNGLAYLIKKHDSLSKISNKVYGTYSKWKPIWENNRDLIHNPDIIFAGFTVYCPDNNID